MTGQPAPVPTWRNVDNTGAALVNGFLYTYAAGTLNPQASYTDSTQGVANTNPVQLNSRGEASVWLNPNLMYKLVLTDQNGNLLWSQDQVPGGYLAIPLAASQSTSIALLASLSQTSTEISAGITPTNYAYAPQVVLRYGTNTTPGSTDMAAPIQNAIDSAGISSPLVLGANILGLSKPILLRASTQQDIAFNGNGRVTCNLVPLASSIAASPQNTNTLIFNQNNNDHFHLAHTGCTDSVGYTGVFLYATNGGGADGSAKAMFSMVVDDCWFAFSTNNSGIFRGTFSNLQVVNCVFEGTKTGCFILEGSGSSDQSYVNVVMNACYDSFLYGSFDANIKADISVRSLHVYQHFRGPAFEITNGVELDLDGIIVEPNSANVGGTGLFKFTDCSSVLCTNSICKSRSGVPQAAIAIQIINGCTGKFANIISDALVGVQFSGAGVLDLTFDNCDFSGANICLQILSGTQSGNVIFRGCRFNNAQQQCFLHSAGTPTFNMEFHDCEFMNAGLGGVSTNYNVDISLSGLIKFFRCKIGHDNGSALSAYYINNNGAGQVQVFDPVIVGTPPTAVTHGTGVTTFDGIDSNTPGFTTAMSLTPGGTAVLGTVINRWSLKGGFVSFWADITITTIGTGSATSLSGLPFTSSATAYGGGVVHFFSGSATSVVDLNVSVPPAGTSLSFRSLTAAAAGTANNNILQNGTRVIMQGSYPL